MKKKYRNSAGFTLFELLVGIFIIMSMSTLFLVNYQSANKRSDLNLTKQRLASDLRLAQNYSLGAKAYNGASVPAGGWGVHFDLSEPGQYLIFADIDGDKAYNAAADGAVEIKTLPGGITLGSLSPGNAVDIVFLPPDPVTFINGATAAEALITLKENVNNSTGEVLVNFFGLIDTD